MTHRDRIPGGLADKKEPSNFPTTALRKGCKIEGEHTNSPSLAREIAMDHLTEDRRYYDKLEQVEKKAEEFKLQGHTTVQGLPIAIENRKGSVRKGVDKDGKPWRTVMKNPYGYFKGTKGADGEEIDVYVGPNKKAPEVYVVHQRKDDGKTYDEDKVMIGFDSEADARKAFLAHYNSSKFLGPISALPVEKLKTLFGEKKVVEKIAMYLAFSDELGKIQPLL